MAAKLGIKPNAGLSAIRDVAGGGTLRTVTTATQRGTTMQWGTCQAQSGANVVVLLDGSASAVVVPVAPDLSISSCVGRRVLVAGRSAADWVVVAGGDSAAVAPVVPTEVWFGTAQSVSGANLNVLLDGSSTPESIALSADLQPSDCVGRRVVVVGTGSNRLVIALAGSALPVPLFKQTFTPMFTRVFRSGYPYTITASGDKCLVTETSQATGAKILGWGYEFTKNLILDITCSSQVNTTNNSTNYWSYELYSNNSNNAFETLLTFTTQNDAVNTAVLKSALNVNLNAAALFGLFIMRVWRVGNPGDFFPTTNITYRYA